MKNRKASMTESESPLNCLGAWISTAIRSGGTLHVVKGKNGWYYANMFWPQLPDEAPIEGSGMTVEGALSDLNIKLEDDAAEEMRQNPMSGV